jgi:hypothetical protein
MARLAAGLSGMVGVSAFLLLAQLAPLVPAA